MVLAPLQPDSLHFQGMRGCDRRDAFSAEKKTEYAYNIVESQLGHALPTMADMKIEAQVCLFLSPKVHNNIYLLSFPWDE